MNRDWGIKGFSLALAIIVASFGIAASQGKPIQKCTCGAASQQTAEPDKRGTESAPLSVKLLNTGESDAEAAQKTDAIKHTEKTERWTIGLTIALVAATVLQFGALLWQGRQLKRQIALGNAEFIASHRPRFEIREAHLAVIHCPADPPERTDYQLRFLLANSGDGGGTLVESYALVMEIPKCTWKHMGAEGGINDFGHVTLAAGAQSEIAINLSVDNSESVALLLAMYDDNQSLASTLYFRGSVVYKDLNGTRRRTSVCRPLDPGTKRFDRPINSEYDRCD